ncbi:hypothetical protein SAMD00019534_097450 [Acytostelium subglobosum LB1]|uniref:hypothetical protein n=1 Tax=Acytostelium subglobosum LB1 TaxID=1410327 RepID=UPI00064510F4|nr:hypothetical protein SAMD00019534_097450 [Acytostelium subglobosum LB1]GAM26570.1 hypothetical protein SAMD00019534_097450 [Acytostelium subglobosum LB1]|eukprot:XP_012750666.1 hypothetical protein SAMD00019534_097450 [Acytostelium subglobosum LB1]
MEDDSNNNNNNNNVDELGEEEFEDDEEFASLDMRIDSAAASSRSKLPAQFEIDNIPGLSRKKKSKKKDGESNPLTRLPEKTKELIMKGMQQYTAGQYQEALDSFFKVMELSPRYPRTYTMMSLIYQDMGNDKKVAWALYLAAEVGGRLPELWKRAAKASVKVNDYATAIKCYKRVLRQDKEDLESIYDLSCLYANEGIYDKAYLGFKSLHALRPEDPSVITYLVSVAISLDKLDEAIEIVEAAMDNQFGRDFAELDLDLFNIMMELYNKAREFEKTVDFFPRVRALFPDNIEIPLDIVLNAAIAYYSMGEEKMGDVCYRQIMKNDVNSIGDIYFSLGEKLKELNMLQKALPLFLALLRSDNFEKKQVLYYVGSIYKDLHDPVTASKYLEIAVEDDPTFKESALLLSDIYKELGQYDMSLSLLTNLKSGDGTQAGDDETEEERYNSTLKDLESRKETLTSQDVRELTKIAEDYLALKKIPQYLGIARALLHGSTNDIRLRNPSKLAAALNEAYYNKKKRENRKEYTYVRTISDRPNIPFAEKMEEDDYFKLVNDMAKVLCARQRHDEAAQLIRYALKNVKLNNPSYSHQLKFFLVGIAYQQDKPFLAFRYFKYACDRKPYSHRLWNLFNKVVNWSKGDYYISNKPFLNVLMEKYPKSLPIRIIAGNFSMHSTPKCSLIEYLKAYKYNSKEPLLNLLIGITILNQAASRKQPDRHKLVITAFTFLYKYKHGRLPEETQEAYYNMGRAAQQLGIFYLAIDYYNKVLQCKEESEARYSLKAETAFNLSLMYKKDNPELAKHLLDQYCVI